MRTGMDHESRQYLIDLAFGASVGGVVVFVVVLTAWVRPMEAECATLRARLAHYQEVTHTTPPLCVDAEVVSAK